MKKRTVKQTFGFRLFVLFLPMMLPLLLLHGCEADEDTETEGNDFALTDGSPTTLSGDVSCEDLNPRWHEESIDEAPWEGTHVFKYFDFTVSNVVNNRYFDWSSTMGVEAVLVKGANKTNYYPYDNATSDSGLVCPDYSIRCPATISQISICVDFALEVTKDAHTTFTREFDWTIEKTTDLYELTLANGQPYSVPYSVMIGADHVDSGFAVSGTITIRNPSPFTAYVKEITDTIEGIGTIDVLCPEFDYVIPAGGEVICTYNTTLPDDTPLVNEVTVETWHCSKVKGGSATADIIFDGPTEVIDECVSLEDSLVDLPSGLETICEPKTVSYCYRTVPDDCGYDYSITNIATITEMDSQEMHSDSVKILVHVPECDDGCTLTQGYWKNHSRFGNAPYDDTWANLVNGASTLFMKTDMTYLEVLRTPPKGGNAYFIFAHQYIAAELNQFKGASSTEMVDMAMNAALHLLEFEMDLADFKGKAGRALRAEYIYYAGILGDYNEGTTGPGHCDENNPPMVHLID